MRDRLLRVQELLGQGQGLSALRLAEEAARSAPELASLHRVRAQCLAGLGRFADAMAAIDDELRRDPGSVEALDIRARIVGRMQDEEAEARLPRRWQTSVSKEMFETIERSAHRYTYRGYPLIKNPFDMALYSLLLWNLKPATIFEIGSYNGASALWMTDMLAAYGADAHVHSLDVVKVSGIEHPRITFHEGSGRNLSQVFPAQMIESCQRPFLVIDDADHAYETSKAVLDHFHPHMRTDEYFVVEDGLSAPGPRQALTEFLPAHADEWKVDSHYCDFFGYNATWCLNGFLRRVA